MAAESKSSLGDEYERLEKLCRSTVSIASNYAQSPEKSPGDIGHETYGSHHLRSFGTTAPESREPNQQEKLDWARRCGNFGNTEPSELFLHAYHDLLQCLHHDPLANCVSPSLCGSTGYVPMTIIAPLNDQLRHISNLIVRAKSEVLFATNFWKASGATTFVCDALRELSKRAGDRKERVVVKLMYDRGDLRQFINPHQNVPPNAWTSSGVELPSIDQIPNIDLAVVNFHQPPLGTFHSKFMIVDRQIATVSSNNVQDNDNLEMMSHLEGPIVNSLWETFVVSWHNKLEPALPCRTHPVLDGLPPSYQKDSFKHLFDDKNDFRLPEQAIEDDLPEHMPHEPHYDVDVAAEINRMRSVLRPASGESHGDAVARHLNRPTGLSLKATVSERQSNLHFFPFIPIPPTDAVPIAMASRKPYADLNNKSEFVPQNEAFWSLIRNAKRNVFIQTPDLNAKPLLPAIIAAVKRGIEITYYVCLGYNDTGELLPGQGGTNEMAANTLYSQLSDSEKERLKIHFYVAADQDHPIHNKFKQRSCHIKLLIADEQVAIQGSGNQDTQSWFHSQEVNVMIDSPVVCKAWREGIERNQNTGTYGRVAEDGCYYDKDGNLAPGSFGTDAGKFAWVKGVMGTLKKAQGK